MIYEILCTLFQSSICHLMNQTNTHTPHLMFFNLLLQRGFEYSIGLIMGCSFKLPDLSDTNQRIQHLLSIGIRFSALLQCVM